MNAIVVYKSKYGCTKTYAQWIAEELSCDICEQSEIKIDELKKYDIIIYGGGLYAEIKKNFKGNTYSRVKMFNFPGKMIVDELSLVHKTAIKALKKLMSDKENPTEMEKLLIDLCDADGDFSDKSLIYDLIEYVKL